MDQKIEDGTPPNPAPTGTPPANGEVKVEITQKELDDLKHKAEVSSQNFERLKKANETNEQYKARIEELEQAALEGVPSGDFSKVQGELSEVKEQLAKTEVLKRYPELEEKWADLEAWRQLDENKGMNLNTAAKAFMVEKELLIPRRPGLEKPTGGTHVPVQTGMSADDAKALREGDSKKYRDALLAGKVEVK